MQLNKIFCRINWEQRSTDIEISDNNFKYKYVNYTINTIGNSNPENNNLFFDRKRQVFISVLGVINNIDRLRSNYSKFNQHELDFICLLYKDEGISSLEILDGVFVIFIFDIIKKKGFFYQSFHGYYLPLYYSIDDEGVYFSTNLKSILQKIDHKEIDIKSCRDFLHFQCVIPNNKTLVEHIYKVIPNTYVIIDIENKNIIQKKTKYKFKKYSLSSAKSNLLNSIKENYIHIINKINLKNLALTHTKGWDSNFLLYETSLFSDKQINTITINGGDSVNEIPDVQNIQKYYSNLNPIFGEVSGNLLDYLVNLAWIYEGYVFDGGMFLRLELAKSLKKENLSAVILGACGDQILYPPKGYRKIIREYPKIRYFLELIINRHRDDERLFRKRIKRTIQKLKVDTSIECMLKMHGIILNAYEIESYYPFISKEIESISYQLGKRNFKKRFYKKNLAKMLPKEIVRSISKSTIVVDYENLFHIDEDLIQKIFNSNCVKNILSKKQINKVLCNPKSYHLLIIHIIYIYIFNELFISGKYDMIFDNQQINMTFDQLKSEQ